jgi:hypothetical protein
MSIAYDAIMIDAGADGRRPQPDHLAFELEPTRRARGRPSTSLAT